MPPRACERKVSGEPKAKRAKPISFLWGRRPLGRRKIRPYTLETLAVHGGQAPGPGHRQPGGADLSDDLIFFRRFAPCSKSSFRSTKRATSILASRNPTVDMFEKRMALLEGGVAAVATASGQAAMTSAILALAKAGDHVVASSHLYGGTYTLFAATLPQMGIEVTFVDPRTRRISAKPSRPRTKAVVGEVIGNPRLHVLDLEAVAAIAHEQGVPSLSTTPSPRRRFAGPSNGGRTSSSIRPRSGSVVMARRSAGSSSTGGALVG